MPFLLHSYFTIYSNDTDNTSDSSANSGTLILDATCAPQNIKISSGC